MVILEIENSCRREMKSLDGPGKKNKHGSWKETLVQVKYTLMLKMMVVAGS